MATRVPRSSSVPSTSRKKAGKGKPSDLMAALKSFVRSSSETYLKDPNITSVGIGYKIKDGARTKEVAVQFTVGTKVQPESIGDLDSVPIPPVLIIDGHTVPTDVLERSYQPSYVNEEVARADPRRSKADVLAPGISIGNTVTTAGTLGCFVRERASGKTVILSNWHVLQGPYAEVGVDIVQPGKYDDNRVEQNKIGKLLRSHLGPAGDCAIASITSRSIRTDILDLGVAVAAIAEPELGDHVIKSGRTTAVTRGVVNRIEVNTLMTYAVGCSAQIGGFEIEPDPEAPAAGGEISKSGDSGAIWLASDSIKKKNGIMLGLHFGGNNGGSEFALACYAKSVFTKLDIEPLAASPQAVFAETVAAVASGFDGAFLTFPVKPAKFIGRVSKDLADLDGDQEIRYCHFSVWLSKSRKYPVCAAWNIDGSRFRRMARTGFRTDRRGDLEAYQLTDKIYVRNPLDKGHIARRADLCWGTAEEARQANYDSSYYTNIAPQHEAFNQSGNKDDDEEGGLWGRLENTLLDTEAPHQLRMSLIAGPIFGKGDRKFSQGGEECLLPDEFWKLVAYTDAASAEDRVYGFLLSQRSMLDPLAGPESLHLDEWLWARIALADLENLVGIRFSKELHAREVPFVAAEAVSDRPAVKIVTSPDAYFS